MPDLDARATPGARLREHAVLVIGDGLFDLLAAVSVEAACMGLGFAWFPEERIRAELDSGRLKPKRMREGLGAIVPGPGRSGLHGPGHREPAQVIRQGVAWNAPSGAIPSGRVIDGARTFHPTPNHPVHPAHPAPALILLMFPGPHRYLHIRAHLA